MHISGIAEFCQQLHDAAIGVSTGGDPDDLTLIAKNVVYSFTEQPQDQDFIKEFIQSSNNPVLVIQFPKMTGIDPEYRNSHYEIKARLYFSMSANVDQSFLLIVSLLDEIKIAWKDNNNFSSPWGSADDVSWSDPDKLDLEQPLFLWCELTVKMIGC